MPPRPHPTLETRHKLEITEPMSRLFCPTGCTAAPPAPPDPPDLAREGHDQPHAWKPGCKGP